MPGTDSPHDSEWVKSLAARVPPPMSPVNSGSLEDWQTVTAEIGLELPHELYLLNSVYGSGWFVQGDFWIEIHSVFRPAFALLVEFNRRVFSQEAQRCPDPYSSLFELGAYGREDDEGSVGRIFWDTTGPVAAWRIGLSRPLQRYSLGLTEFLTKSFTNQIRPSGFPEEFTSVNFVPWNDHEAGAGA